MSLVVETPATADVAKVAKKPVTRIYVAESLQLDPNTPPAAPRLIRASHPSHVFMHLAKAQFGVAAATTDQVADLLIGGTKLEIAGEE